MLIEVRNNNVAIKRTASITSLSLIVLLTGLTVLIAWVFDIRPILSIFQGAPTMKFNTALLFVLSSLSILGYQKNNILFKKIVWFLGASIILISTVSLSQYFSGADYGLDNLIKQDLYSERYPGRMSRTTAICFALFGIALLSTKSAKEDLRKLGKYCLGLIALISLLAILTFILQIFAEARVLIFNSMAFHTAFCFLLISFGLSLSNPKHSYVDLLSGVFVGSKFARQLLPFLVILPLFLSFILLSFLGTNAMNTEVGIALYTITYALFGLLFATWVASRLNKEDKERKQLQDSIYSKNEELESAIRFKKQLVRTSPETILIINLNDLNVRYINKDIYPEEGLNREKILGMPIIDILPFIHPRDRENIMDFHKKLLKSQDDDVHDLELRLKLKRDSWEWFSVRGKIFHRRDKDWVDEYVLLVRNISAKKETQKALMNAEKYSILGEVAKTLAHELRNPISSISMATDIIVKKMDASHKNENDKYLKILKRSTDTLNNLVSNLLNTTNYSQPDLKCHDLAEIVECTLLKASDRIYLTGIEIDKIYEVSHKILADKEKLEIALLNIIVNASEAMVPQEGIIKILIRNFNNNVELSISDNGHGMEQEQIDNLFDVFYTTKKNGIGVGLNAVKTILEDHEAKIEVSSTINKGTTFKILFPSIDT